MDISLGVLIEVTEIRVKKNPITNKRQYFKKKRMLFIADIAGIREDIIINRSGTDYNDCTSILLNTNEILKIEESYKDLKDITLKYWEELQKIEKEQE
jgi:hypothetical protein